MLVSIVIPTYNEAADIHETLDSLMALTYAPVEVLVVDASSDETPQIVTSYSPDRVRLIRQSRGHGRAAARNEGILLARGEIVIILNADVRLPSNFIQSVLPYYANGADYVLVESRVANLEHATARYVQALHEFHYPPRPNVEARINWTEGFSCRREAALEVNLIPEGDSVTLVAGEDSWFGDKLESAGYRKAFDHSILVTHVMPPDLPGFWRQRVGRGQGTVQIWHERHGWSVSKLRWAVARLTCLIGLGLLLPVPALWRGWRLTRYSPRGYADWIAMTFIDWIASAANVRGLWVGLSEVSRATEN
ncbi:MAG: glycosyltransferase [Chloroflexi bacterium]|nr:glycosyltransferase [Chloroflexota bacterium]